MGVGHRTHTQGFCTRVLYGTNVGFPICRQEIEAGFEKLPNLAPILMNLTVLITSYERLIANCMTENRSLASLTNHGYFSGDVNVVCHSSQIQIIL